MTPERWRQITAIYHEAAALGGEAREAYLAHTCGGDAKVRREIESLLAHGAHDSFLTSPVTLPPGSRIGTYELLEVIGAGGMGIVYRARDVKLQRDVALKVLPEAVVRDPDRVARFRREATLLASLNHPNIGAIYGFEDSGDVHALVLELVDGPTLADRIARGPIPLDEALPIARQIAEALEAAHEQSIIHRDLKPANIKLRPDGTVKVLDFGLAKTFDSPTVDASHKPVITNPAPITGAGVLLGTASHMAPEQACGKTVDRRTDIWAFGCVFYEMLTGRQAFAGNDVSDTLAAVLRSDVDWSVLPDDLPPPVAVLLKRCLDRDRRTRVGDMSVIRFVLDETPGIRNVGGRQSEEMRHAHLSASVPWVIAAALASALVYTAWRQLTGTNDQASPVRLSSNAGADISMSTVIGPSAVLSPDGKTLAFAGGKTLGDAMQLYVRPLNQLQATPLAGTEGAFTPFFSPDGLWLAFFAEGKLKKIPVKGGAVVTLCDAPNARGGDWGMNRAIIFQPQSQSGPLMRVTEEGGKPEIVFKPPDGALLRWPQFLPSSNAVLFSEVPTIGSSWDLASIVVQPLPSGVPRVLVRGGFYGRYVSSGHLLYMHHGTMFAAPMDLARLELTGPAVPVVADVLGASLNSNNGSVQFAVADNGTAVYRSAEELSTSSSVQWVDSAGEASPLRAMAADWSNPAFSPDGDRLAMDISDGSQTDIWTYHWARDTLTRLTFDRSDDVHPVWSPDGSRIAFASKRGGNSAFDLYWERADGTGEPERLTTTRANASTGSWHPSGKFLAYDEAHTSNGRDLMILPMEGDEKSGWKPGKPYTFLATTFNEESPMFSPDGRWIAYTSNESGRYEIYVRPFPGPGGKWQVSSGTADDATWSRIAKQLFFVSINDQRIMVAPFETEGDSFRAEKPRLWSRLQIAMRPRPPSRDLDLHPDGKRFALAAATPEDTAKLNHLILIFNFFNELRSLAPPK